MTNDPDADQAPDEESESSDPPAFEPTGLDLAHQIADMVAHSAPLPPPMEPPKKKTTRRPASSRRSKDDPMPLGEALGSVIRQRGWSTELNVHTLLGRWPSLVGETVADHSTPEGYADGVITVRTDSTAWASQLRLMVPQLVAKLNETLGDGTIKRIAIKGPDAPTWKHGRRSVSDGRGPRDTYG